MRAARSTYERFNKIYRDIVSHPDHCEEFAELGITPEDFGTHSIYIKGRCDAHLYREHGVSAYRIDLPPRELSDAWRS